ncbi:MAG: DUF2651 family protein [Clostridia bacterium]|jgi:hypothetical protein|nr:DUF2651 family protein [Clostridia bacterium]
MGNLLLLLFALPVATIIIASVLERQIKSPIAVASLIFAIYLIVTFAVFDASFLVYAIIYTILAFISAVITRLILNFINDREDDYNICDIMNCNNNTNSLSDINTINNTNSNNCGCGCNRYAGNRYYR